MLIIAKLSVSVRISKFRPKYIGLGFLSATSEAHRVSIWTHRRMAILLSGYFPNNIDDKFHSVKPWYTKKERNLPIVNVTLKLHMGFPVAQYRGFPGMWPPTDIVGRFSDVAYR